MPAFFKKIFINSDGRLRSGWRFFLSVLVVLIAVFVANIVANVIAQHRSNLLFESINRPLSLAIALLGFVVMLLGLDRVEQDPLEAQGLGTSGAWLRHLWMGLGLGFGMIALAVAATKTFGSFHAEFIPSANLLPRFFAITWILATAAMLEEVCFRGYPFQRLIEGVGPWGATAILSGLFGVIHLGNPHATIWSFLNTVLIGVLLSLAYLQTRTMWLPFGIHLAWNFTLGTIFGLPVSGITYFVVFVRGNAQGPEWLTGGSYGIEASMPGALVAIIGIIALSLLGPTLKQKLR